MTALAMVLGVAALMPVAAVASHQYNDVPSGYTYHKAIDAITDAGISNGCGGGSFCPTDFIRRDHMAVWLNRTAGRIAESTSVSDTTVRDADGDTVVGSVSITVPGVAGGTQFVEVLAQVTIQEGFSDCPCMVVGEVHLGGSATSLGSSVVHVPTGGPFFDVNTLTVVAVTAVPPGVQTFDVVVNTVGATALMDVTGVHLVARTIPFGHAGGNVL